MITLPPRQSSVQKRGTTTAPRAELDPAPCPPALTITGLLRENFFRLRSADRRLRRPVTKTENTRDEAR
jgi:hypothetical protein